MLPPATRAGGQIMAMPDLNKKTVPPGVLLVLPLPNLVMLSMLSPASCPLKTRMSNMQVGVMGSKAPMSSGDEGMDGGLVSSKLKGACTIKLGSSKVMAEGKRVAYVGGMCECNGAPGNSVGTIMSSMEIKVKVSP